MFRVLVTVGMLIVAVCADPTSSPSPAVCGGRCKTDADCGASSPCGQCILVDNSINYSLCSHRVVPTTTYQTVSVSNQAGEISSLTVLMNTPANASSWTSLEVLFTTTDPVCTGGEREWFEIRNSDSVLQVPVPGGNVFLTDPSQMTSASQFFINLLLFEIPDNNTCAFEVKIRSAVTKAQPVSLSLPTGSSKLELTEQQVFVYTIKTPNVIPFFFKFGLSKSKPSTVVLRGPISPDWYRGAPIYLLNATSNSIIDGTPPFNVNGTDWSVGYVFAGPTVATASVSYLPIATQAFNGTFIAGSFTYFVASQTRNGCVHFKGTWGKCYIWSGNSGYNDPMTPTSTFDFRFPTTSALLPNGTTVYGTQITFCVTDTFCVTGTRGEVTDDATGCAGTLTYGPESGCN